MSGFSSLPLELRSLILDGWLKDTLGSYRVEGTADSYYKTWALYPQIYTSFTEVVMQRIEKRRAVVNTIAYRRKLAALVIRNRIHAFLADEKLELERLLDFQLTTWLEEGRTLCARTVALRKEVYRLDYDYGRDGIREEWLECVQEIDVLQWLCHIVQMAMDVDEDRWWWFNFHRIACGWGRRGCRCEEWGRGTRETHVRP